MLGSSEKLSAEFARWEYRGRGLWVSEYPVRPEPIFFPFPGHGIVVDCEVADDGRKPTLVTAFIRKLTSGRKVSDEAPVERESRTPDVFEREEVAELRLFLPSDLRFSGDRYVSLLSSLSAAYEPIVFELVADGKEILIQCSLCPRDEGLFRRQLEVFFPEVVAVTRRDTLKGKWTGAGEGHVAIAEFGLCQEFMIPLSSPKGDPLAGIVGALSDIGEGEVALFQVMCEPVRHPWADSVMRSVTNDEGDAFFVNAPELLSGAKQKLSTPLFAAVVRIAAKSPNPERMWEIAANVAGGLGVFGGSRTNELVPLRNTYYPAPEHEGDVISRQTRRSGMILSAEELVGFFHFPSSDIGSPKIRTAVPKFRKPPATVTTEKGARLGVNIHWDEETPVCLSAEERAQHMHIIGASGTGKSTLLFNLIRGDLERGDGFALLDPHGDLIDAVLGIIPDDRIKDVIVIDPSDEDFVVGFNVLSAHSDLERNLLAADLVSVFRRLSSSWGDQMGSVLQNAILTFLESSDGGTLADLRRFLIEPRFREEFLKSVRDPEMVYYWRHAFPQLGGNRSIGSIVTRLEMFLSPKIIRRMVSLKANNIDFRDIMDGGKIVLAKLSQGAIGPENSYLLGSLLVAKIHQQALSRERQAIENRRPFWLYIDECHHFLTGSMAEILSGARKYRLGLTLCHQELRQVSRDADVGSALLANAYTRIVFRVGEEDARELAKGFSYFGAADLVNLGKGEAICRVERSTQDFNLKVELPPKGDAGELSKRRAKVIAASRQKYGTPRKDIEAMFSRFPTLDGPKAWQPSPVEAAPEPAKAVSAETDMGRGGVQHQAIQKRLKDCAEALGFRAVIEKKILEGAGSVDLVCEKDGQSVACEITITTTIDQEMGNVAKCLKAGFGAIALVAVTPDRLLKLKAAVLNSFGQEAGARVGYYLPDAFLAYLKEMPVAVATLPAPTESRSRGYKIKRTFVPLSPEETKERESAALTLMAEAMKKGQGK